MSISPSEVRRTLPRVVWYVRCVLGFSLVFAGLWGVYAAWGPWTFLLSPVSIITGGLIVPGVAERLPRHW